MAYVRLGESVQTIYAELLDQLRAADAEAALRGLSGTFVSKQIRGRTYWYLQKSEGAAKRQIYLGAESPQLLKRIEDAASERVSSTADEKRRRDIVAMLEAGGMYRESASIGVVLRILADASVFRAGGVLVGPQAFTAIANMLGVKVDTLVAKTNISVGIHEPAGLTLTSLHTSDPAFFSFRQAGSRRTSFKVRGRDLRVDFLTPASKTSRKPVFLRHLRVAAQPLEGLGYLIDNSVDAAVIAGGGVHVNVPAPARFALHKLWLAAERPASEAAKAKKDLRQAEQLLDVLTDDRPDDVAAAWEAISPRKLTRGVRRSIKKLQPSLIERVKSLIS